MVYRPVFRAVLSVTEPKTEIVEGTVERVVFDNADTHWAVLRIVPDQGGAPITAVGALYGLAPGLPLRLRGQWIRDARYGRQFQVSSYQTRTPETLVGLKKYLGSGTISGVGQELAERIVARFGLQTARIIEQTPERLTEVEGIGPARVQRIAEAWAHDHELRDVMIFLQSHGIAPGHAARILRRYGRDAMAVVRENPYRLALDVQGIGFRSADAVARSLGVATTAPERIEAGLLHALGELAEHGHLHAPVGALESRARELLGVDTDLLAPALERLVQAHLVVAEALGDRGRCMSLTVMWEHEHESAALLGRLLRTPMARTKLDVERALGAFETAHGLALAPAQRQAVTAAVRDKCVVITGGPGVGKTTIVRAIVHLLGAAQRRLALAAPTGRAAKRLSESTGGAAATLHRLLEFQPQERAFQRNAEQPLEVDALVVDEASMIDIALFRALLCALPATAQLILVGDVDQLPSVGPGAVLGDVIASGMVTVVRLTEIFRQAASSAIVQNAHRINSGEAPVLDPPPGSEPARSDFYFVARPDPARALDTLLDLVATRIPERFGFDPLTQIQVLTPMHRGQLGTVALNTALQERLNPGVDERFELRRGERVFRRNDKIMQLRNDYEKEVWNGDVGIVRELLRGDDGPMLLAEMLDGRPVRYKQNELDDLVHAYAISVHKSQGSEYPCVVLPLLGEHYMMLQRNLLYTAITRGKQLVVLLGSQRAVLQAVHNNAPQARWTWLAERLREAAAPA
jgi:exodeoxyribonuclease V alpha subunit